MYNIFWTSANKHNKELCELVNSSEPLLPYNRQFEFYK